MLQRAMYDRLLAWKEHIPEKALLVDGARQVGKGYKRHVARVCLHAAHRTCSASVRISGMLAMESKVVMTTRPVAYW